MTREVRDGEDAAVQNNRDALCGGRAGLGDALDRAASIGGNSGAPDRVKVVGNRVADALRLVCLVDTSRLPGKQWKRRNAWAGSALPVGQERDHRGVCGHNASSRRS